MSYIGKEPIVGNFQVCDAISVVNGQAAYTMQVSSTNVVPESANHMLVSLNGILQKPNSSFTVSGSTITFASNLATGDVIDFIMLLGNVLDIGTPSDSTVTDAKANFVSTSSGAGLQIKGDGTTDGTLQLNCSQNSHGIKLKSPPHSAGQSYTLTFPSTAPATDKILQTDSSGVLSFVDAGGGITMADQFRLSADQSGGTNGIVTSNLERVDTYGFGQLGTGMTESSGVFTFPSTGIYLILFTARILVTSSDGAANIYIETTTDNSNFNEALEVSAGMATSGGAYQSAAGSFIFDVTDTTTHKFHIKTSSMGSGSYITGHTSTNTTHLTVIRLGDT